MSYPITYAAGFTEKRSRLTTFFRYFMVIPHMVVLLFYGLAAAFAIVGAWFAIVFTGRYPEGLYAFNSGFLRYITRVYAYLYLATDVYPPFNGAEDPDYPVQLAIGAPKPQYSRVKAFFRIIVAIPVLIVSYVMSLILSLVGVVSWFYIVILGKQNESLHGALDLALAYTAKANGYLYLLTEDYPPFTNEPPAMAAAPTGAPLTSPEAPPSTTGSEMGLPDLPPPPPRD